MYNTLRTEHKHPVLDFTRGPMDSHSDLTNLLIAYGKGEKDALDRLIPKVYDQLKVLASARLRSERADHTLNTTGLVNEVYLKMTKVNSMDFKDRGHFYALASKQMRRILVDWSRKRNAIVRTAKNRVSIDEAMVLSVDQAENILELEDALETLAKVRPRVGQVMEMRYYGGLQNKEIAEALKIGLATVERDVAFGRAWLAREWKESES